MGSIFQEENDHDQNDFVIVGGGIGGLATALALHRKGFKNVAVYEKSDNLRADGSAIGIFANGWRALDQLGVGHQLRDKALLLHGGQDVLVDEGTHQNFPLPAGEARCLKRGDLVNALADALPPKTIRFGSKAVSVKMDPQNGYPTLQLCDRDPAVKAKVLIGCEGSNSIVGDFLGLNPTSLFSVCAVRGLTTYPNGHSFTAELVRMKRDKRDRVMVGRIPIDNNLVYWFVTLPLSWLDGNLPDDPTLIKQSTLRMTNGFLPEAVKMIEESDLDSLSLTRLRHRSPWEALVGNFHRGPVTVAGDAMHVMGPFLGQGGSAALEDAVVLARNLGRRQKKEEEKIGRTGINSHLDPTKLIFESEKNKFTVADEIWIAEALDGYVKERRMRIVLLCTQAFLTGMVIGTPPSLSKSIALVLLAILFRDRNAHAKYNCANL